MIRPIINNILIAAFIWSFAIYPFAQLTAQDICSQNLKLAEQNYFEGNFEQSIELVKTCLQTGNLKQSDKIWAYKILAQTYLAKNNPDAARTIVKKILEINPDYAPTIVENPPPYVELVNSVKDDLPATTANAQSDDSKWLWIGAGGVAVVGIITIIALSNGNGEDGEPKSLPTPPSFPTTNE